MTPRYTVKTEANRNGYETHTIWDTACREWAWSYLKSYVNCMGDTISRPEFLIFNTEQKAAAQREADRLNAQYEARPHATQEATR